MEKLQSLKTRYAVAMLREAVRSNVDNADSVQYWLDQYSASKGVGEWTNDASNSDMLCTLGIEESLDCDLVDLALLYAVEIQPLLLKVLEQWMLANHDRIELNGAFSEGTEIYSLMDHFLTELGCNFKALYMQDIAMVQRRNR